MKYSIIALSAVLFAGAPVLAQSGGTWQFRWQKGQTLDYRVSHNTLVAETVSGSRVETSSKLSLVKRWQVLDVDARNVAVLQLTVTSLRHEQTRPNGEVLLFDSMDPARTTPEMRSMSDYVGKVLASVRVDGSGQVVEVMQGVASRFESEPPFIVVLPGKPALVGQAWQRAFQAVLDPPLGTGEKYQARQTYRLASIDKNRATLTLATEFQTQPESMADRLPLLQKQPQGQIVFDWQTGRMLAARLAIDKTLENHQGPGSSYRFQSQYSEDLLNER